MLEKKAKVRDQDAHWENIRRSDGLLGRHFAGNYGLCAEAAGKEDKASGLLPKAARWLGEHRDGDYWFSTKQTAMVIDGLTDYLTLSGELANEATWRCW